MPLLGAYTLAPDPVNRRLIRVRGLAMAALARAYASLPPRRLPAHEGEVGLVRLGRQ